MPSPKFNFSEYTIGWICALTLEYETACAMLDREFVGPSSLPPDDMNTYTYGQIGPHKIIIGCLPEGIYGIERASRVAKTMTRTFPQLKFALVVGIGGGVPTRQHDIRLGDIVVGKPSRGFGGLLHYELIDDRGATGPVTPRSNVRSIRHTSYHNAPPEVVQHGLAEMQRRYSDPRYPDMIAENVKRFSNRPGFHRPAVDLLYESNHEHQSGKTCSGCGQSKLVRRPARQSNSNRAVVVHYGTIASGNRVMKNGLVRDKFAQDRNSNIMCFEMEAAGLMNNLPCLVVRGICDYSDTHKNDAWQGYASLTGAAYARELLMVISHQRVQATPPWSVALNRV
ncbi:nucleoside phosphorylase domain-containing protein [Aspergillus crustosus]